MDELFEAATLIQTGKIESFPVVLFCKDYWKPLVDLLNEMVEVGTIDAEDLKLLLFTDSVDEAMTHINEHAVVKFGLIQRRLQPRSRVFAESPRPGR